MNLPAHCDQNGRYRLIAELQPRAGSTVGGWRAADLAFGDEVVIYPLPTDLPDAAGRIALFETAFARVNELANPGVVRWHSLDLTAGVAVREWVNGFTLLDLLRRQRKLSVPDALALLDGLPSLLDWLSAHGAMPPGDLLDEVWVTFQPGIPTGEMLELPMSGWPPHRTGMTLLHPRDFWDQDAECAFDATQRSDTPSSSISARLGRLFRELLGDRIRSKPWRPMPTLNETANQLLAETLDGAVWQSAREFWTAIVAAAAEGAPDTGRDEGRAKPFDFFIPSGRTPEQCRVAILEPQDRTDPPIQLCAGTEFRFGRDESLVDFRTTLLPETPENKSLSVEISRAHARIELRDGAVCLRDGDGQSASRNGTRWNDVALSAQRPVRMDGRGVLNLGNQYSLALTPVPWEQAHELTLGGKVICGLRSTLPCAVVPNPIGGQWPFRRAVWVLTALGFHLDTAGDIEWHQGGAIPPAGIFIRDSDGFWLANAGLPARAIRVGQDEPRPGEAVPLLSGQSLRIGDRLYNVSLRD